MTVREGILLADLIQILSEEAGWSDAHDRAPTARNLESSRHDLLSHVQRVASSNDLELMAATEKNIVEGDLERYANSKAMESSLRNALLELEAMERLLSIVNDPKEYGRVDRSYSLPKHRRNGLPFDEARQAFRSHIARLGNLDKARLSDTEKALIDARKANMQQAAKLYAERQAKALGVELPATQGEGE